MVQKLISKPCAGCDESNLLQLTSTFLKSRHKHKKIEDTVIPFDGLRDAYTQERLAAMHNVYRLNGAQMFPVRVTQTASDVSKLRAAMEKIFASTEDSELKTAIVRYFRRSAEQLTWLEIMEKAKVTENTQGK